MSLQLAPALREALEATDPELRGVAQALGLGAAGRLGSLRPALTRGEGGSATPAVEILAIELTHEGAPDGLTLAACEAAHQSYVSARGEPNATSLGALAIARLLIWAQRAALLGRTPEVLWIGPSARRPPDLEGIDITASCTGSVDGTRRSAAAIAVVRRPS
jgi:hypothetical protein